jgi:hypothetical protein
MTGLSAVGFAAAGCAGAGFAAVGFVAVGFAAVGLTGEAAAAGGAEGFEAAAGAAAFFTDRIALPAGGFAGAEASLLGALAALEEPFFSRLRIRPASSSLMELLWLLAAIDSLSAASSTSLFSRPRSLDSS